MKRLIKGFGDYLRKALWGDFECRKCKGAIDEWKYCQKCNWYSKDAITDAEDIFQDMVEASRKGEDAPS